VFAAKQMEIYIFLIFLCIEMAAYIYLYICIHTENGTIFKYAAVSNGK
jgi:hypothetical protein